MDFYWLKWLELGRALGPVYAYAADHSDYPPLTMALLWSGGALFSGIATEPFIQIKLTLILTLATSTAMYFWFSRNALLTAIFLTVHVIGVIGLAYLDIFAGLWILAAFLLLVRGSPEGFVVLFACAMLTKWQPLIMAPVVALYLLQQKDARNIGSLFFWPLIFLAIASVFDVHLVLQAWLKLQRAISGSFFNAYALGMQGLLDAAIRPIAVIGAIQQQDATLSLQRYEAIDALTRIGTSVWSSARFWIFQALFGFFYLYTLWRFVKSNRQINDLLRSAVQVYIIYFVFRHGVHENHLYMPALLALILAARQRAYLRDAVILNLLHNLNMVYYYGFNGSWPDNSWLEHSEFLTFILSAIYCIWLLAMWKRWLSPMSEVNYQPAQMNST